MINLQIAQTFFTRLSKREKTVFYVTVSVLFVLLFWKLLAEPAFSKMYSQDEEIASRRKQIQLDLRLLSIKDGLKDQMKKYEHYFTQADPSQDTMVTIQREIQTLADKGGVFIGEIRPGVNVNEGVFTRYVVILSCEAKMPELIGFIHALEDSSAMLTVERFKITPKSEGSSIAVCTMTASKTLIP